MPYPILPSLSRAPSYKSTRNLEDGTISDPMESGYVATRPRFTRQRRKFAVTVEKLTAEDLRALDAFEVLTVIGKAGGFYMPNLLPNWSFEVPGASGGGILGWHPNATAPWTVTSYTSASDGSKSVLFNANNITAPCTASLTSTKPVSVTSGEVYQVNAAASLESTVPSDTVSLIASLAIVYNDGSTATVTATLLAASSPSYQQVSASLMIPASGTGATTGRALLSFVASVAAGSPDETAGLTTSVPDAIIVIDAVGMALTTPVQPYGRMPGLEPLGTLVRFTKLPAWKDSAPAGGVKRYDVTFEVTEV